MRLVVMQGMALAVAMVVRDMFRLPVVSGWKASKLGSRLQAPYIMVQEVLEVLEEGAQVRELEGAEEMAEIAVGMVAAVVKLWGVYMLGEALL